MKSLKFHLPIFWKDTKIYLLMMKANTDRILRIPSTQQLKYEQQVYS